MYQFLIHEETQTSMMYDKISGVPEGVIPNVMSEATLNKSDDTDTVSCYVKCNNYMLDTNIFTTDIGDIVVYSSENSNLHSSDSNVVVVYGQNNNRYFNVSNVFSNVFVYGQKVPDTHVLVDLPEEFNDAPETVKITREQNGTYTFTLDNEAVKGRNRHLLADMITERNKQLTASDWTQMPDSPITDEQKQSWRTYRQALRDFPNTYTGGPNDWQASFPTKP
jgi:hypothetical protein